MKTFLRITLLGIFASVGVGLAIGYGLSSEPNSGGHGSEIDGLHLDPALFENDSASFPLPIGQEARTGGVATEPLLAVARGSEADARADEAESVLAPYAPPVASRWVRSSAEREEAEIRPLQADAAQADVGPVGQSAPSPQLRGSVPSVPLRVARVERDEGDNSLTINAQNAQVREILNLLGQQGGLNILASSSVEGTVSASLTGVDVDSALEAILRSTGFQARRDGAFIYVGTAADFQNMEYTLDRISTRIYRPNYITPMELRNLIAPMTSPTAKISVSTPSNVGIGSNNSDAGGDNFAGGDVLIVRDYEVVLAQIDQLVDEVDQRPLQVAIEAMILSVRLDDRNSMGVDFEALFDGNSSRLISGSPLDGLGAIDVTQGGLKFGFLDSSLALFIEALETVGDTNVIASPHLMCMNKQRAEILIGSQLGYVSTTVTENAATQAIEFLEVGTQLRIRPFISRDGMIRMEVHPELSTGSVRVEDGFTLPDKEVTQVTTNIMVQDGSTVIIGGLIREDLGTNISQIPLLGSLPLVGVGFRHKNETIDRREIIVLITPRIMFEPEAYRDGAEAACQYHQRQAIYADKMSPIGRRYYGRRFLRLARRAWNAGDAYSALSHINMSIHFDPSSLEAIALRSEVIGNSPHGSHSPDTHLGVGLAPWNRPPDKGNHHAPWMRKIIGPLQQDPSVLSERYDPGQPGPQRDVLTIPPTDEREKAATEQGVKGV